ncbi:phage tail protein [Rhodoblastus sp.]|jgi:phage tail-like protein|uniref:phage tail protein n=1 Tax=Rhodoblastus sp. TaxID=1962975 RepID=UPI003F99FF27
MAQQRSSTPYGAFNFQLTASPTIPGSPGSVNAGFQEISGLGMEVTEAEYRTGNDPTNYVHKVSGLTKATDVTLKRGIMGYLDLANWITAVRDATYSTAGFPITGITVTIDLMAEDQSGPVMTWKLTNAKPKSYKGAPLNAKGGTDVAIEELVISTEKIDVS